MFIATFKKYWCDFIFEFEEVQKHELKGILEYAYKYHKNTCYPKFSEFQCVGTTRLGSSGYLDVHYCLQEKWGYRGSMWLEKIIYIGDNDKEIIIFSKADNYISPNTRKAFDEFAKIAKDRETNKCFGDF